MPTYDKDPLKGLRPIERHWVLCKLAGESDAQACVTCGLHPSAYNHFPNIERCREVIEELFQAPQNEAIAQLFEAGVKAAKVKRDGLDSPNERIRQACATDILDRLFGKATVVVQQSSDTEEVDRYLLNLKAVTNVLMGTSPEGQGRTLEDSELPALDAPRDVPQLTVAAQTSRRWRAWREKQEQRDGNEPVDISESEGSLLDSGA
jgi:hypothetical protein